MDASYKIVFAGKIVEGFDVDVAKANMRKLFKASDAKVEALFSGKRVVIKKNLDEVTALKFQNTLKKKAGVECTVEAAQPSTPAQPAPPKPPEVDDAARRAALKEPVSEVTITDGAVDGPRGMTLAEPGAMLQDDYTRPDPLAADLSDMSMAPPGVEILEHKQEVPAPQIDLSEMDLAPPGVEILEEKTRVPPLDIDLSELTLAPAGADIDPSPKKEQPPPPDTEGITLAE